MLKIFYFRKEEPPLNLRGKVEVFIIPQVKPKDVIQYGDTIVTIGTTAKRMVSQVDRRIKHLSLQKPPSEEDLKKLSKLVESTEATSKYKSVLDLDQIEEISREEAVKMLSSSPVDNFLIHCRNGETIEISVEQKYEGSIHITHEELYTMLLLKEIFNPHKITVERREEEE